ncbi:MAG: hypothetical protein V7K67_14360 [Nostoc sp.]|uniref:hypothetical protein n=1 Tax=Nostoc sp. TaxID=1180 RepID=UPI002FFB00D6
MTIPLIFSKYIIHIANIFNIQECDLASGQPNLDIAFSSFADSLGRHEEKIVKSKWHACKAQTLNIEGMALS